MSEDKKKQLKKGIDKMLEKLTAQEIEQRIKEDKEKENEYWPEDRTAYSNGSKVNNYKQRKVWKLKAGNKELN